MDATEGQSNWAGAGLRRWELNCGPRSSLSGEGPARAARSGPCCARARHPRSPSVRSARPFPALP